MPAQCCPKCNGTMQPGFPVEIASKGGTYVSFWSDVLPDEQSGWNLATFATEPVFKAVVPINDLLLGFACQQCGFVELYKVSKAQLSQYLKAQNAPKT